MRAIQIGPLDLVGTVVRPIDVTVDPIEAYKVGGVESRNEVFDVGSVQISSLDFVGLLVRPVHLASRDVQINARGKPQAAGDQILDRATVDGTSLDPVPSIIVPVKHPVFRINRHTPSLT